MSRAVVFEEDAVLTPEGVEQIGAMGGLLADFIDTVGTGSTAQDGFDVALLGYIQLRGAEDKSAALEDQPRPAGWVRHRGAFWGTHAYLITRRGAAKLIAQVHRLDRMLPVCVCVCVCVCVRACARVCVCD